MHEEHQHNESNISKYIGIMKLLRLLEPILASPQNTAITLFLVALAASSVACTQTESERYIGSDDWNQLSIVRLAARETSNVAQTQTETQTAQITSTGSSAIPVVNTPSGSQQPGGLDDNALGTTTTTTTIGETENAVEVEVEVSLRPPCQSIVEVVCANENTTVFCGYLSQAEGTLGELLAGGNRNRHDLSTNDGIHGNKGNFLTVFAPSDEAFEALRGRAEADAAAFPKSGSSPPVLSALLQTREGIDTLLRHHFVEDPVAIPRRALACGGSLRMASRQYTETLCVLDGSESETEGKAPERSARKRVFQVGSGNIAPALDFAIARTFDDDEPGDRENENGGGQRQPHEPAMVSFPEIVVSDLVACNGVVHVLDGVLLPATIP